MKLKHSAISLLLVASIVAWAGPFEDALSSYERKDYVGAAKGFRLAAAQGDANAQYNLGLMYDKGQGVLQDGAEAVNWYRLAAAQGDADAQYNLGLMYLKGRGVLQDDAEAVKLFRLAAAQGVANAQYNLGVSYGNGQGALQDDVRAHMWFNLASASGHSGAAKNRDMVAKTMTSQQVGEAQKLARQCLARDFKGCN